VQTERCLLPSLGFDANCRPNSSRTANRTEERVEIAEIFGAASSSFSDNLQTQVEGITIEPHDLSAATARTRTATE